MITPQVVPSMLVAPEGREEFLDVPKPELWNMAMIAVEVFSRKQQVLRWSKAAGFPPAAVTLAMGRLWWAEDIRAWAAWYTSAKPRERDDPPAYRADTETLDGRIVSLTEMCEHFYCRRQRSFTWSISEGFPEAAAVTSSGRVWWAEDIALWWSHRQRYRRYNWKVLGNGKTHHLVQGEDFHCRVSSMVGLIRSRYRGSDLRPIIGVNHNSSTITLRVVPSS